jgi:hypothetical protein
MWTLWRKFFGAHLSRRMSFLSVLSFLSQQVEQRIVIIPGQKRDQDADSEDGHHGAILVVACATSAHGEHDGAQEPPGGAEDEKSCRLHVAEADDIGEGVLREAGDQKQDEGNRDAAVLHEVIVLLDDLGGDDLLYERQSEPAGQQKGKPGADGKTDRGIERSQEGSVEISADETADLSRNRRDQNLKDLDADENHDGEGAEGAYELNELSPVEEEAVEVVIKEKKNTGEDQRQQQRNSYDGISVHDSVTGYPLILLPRKSLQRREHSAPRASDRQGFQHSITKGRVIVKRDIPEAKG